MCVRRRGIQSVDFPTKRGPHNVGLSDLGCVWAEVCRVFVSFGKPDSERIKTDILLSLKITKYRLIKTLPAKIILAAL